MIGPLVSPEVRFSKGTEPALTFRTMLTDEDRSRIPSYIDMYLDGVGIPLHMTGSRSFPKRELISSMIWNSESLEYDTEFWARACLRIGNLYSLSACRVRYLTVDPKDQRELMEKHAALARKFYSRSSRFPKLDLIAQGNSALLDHWMGMSDRAVGELEKLLAAPSTTQERPVRRPGGHRSARVGPHGRCPGCPVLHTRKANEPAGRAPTGLDGGAPINELGDLLDSRMDERIMHAINDLDFDGFKSLIL